MSVCIYSIYVHIHICIGTLLRGPTFGGAQDLPRLFPGELGAGERAPSGRSGTLA